jgi:two-component system, NarL family, response regulator LiaR
MPVRILIVDDHTLMRQGLHEICAGLGGFTVVGEARSGAEAVALRRTAQPDVILMDLAMPEMDGAEAIRRIMSEAPASRIIALTMYREEPFMLAAIRAGARAYLLKTVEAAELIDTVNAVHRGEYLIDPIIAARVLGEFHLPVVPAAKPAVLLETEIAVLRLVAQGLDNREIAKRLHYSEHTVSNRLRTIFDKLHVTNRTQAALYALRQGWASLEDTSE